MESKILHKGVYLEKRNRFIEIESKELPKGDVAGRDKLGFGDQYIHDYI